MSKSDPSISTTTGLDKIKFARRPAIIASVTALLLLALLTWSARGFFLQNHILFLLNQREYPEALGALSRLKSTADQNKRHLLLQTKAYTLTEQYSAAIRTSDMPAESFSKYPETLYWRALAQFQSGDTTGSRLSARQFAQYNYNLPNGGNSIARAMAGPAPVIDSPATQGNRFKMLFPIEQATYLALAFAQQTEIGRLDAAQEYARQAFLAGNRNAASLSKAAEVSALTGDFHDARMFFDYAGAQYSQQIATQLGKQQKHNRSISLSLETPDLTPGKREIDVARAQAWAAIQLETKPVGTQVLPSFTPAQDAIKALLVEFPADPVLESFYARSIAGENPKGAERIWSDLQQTHPSYSTLLLLANAQNQAAATILTSSTQFLEPLKPLPIAFTDTSSTGKKPVSLQILDSKTSLNFAIGAKEHGTYAVSVVARSVHNAKPLLLVKLDGEAAGICYAADANWDSYTVNAPLEPGNHRLEVSIYQSPGSLEPPLHKAEILTVVVTPKSVASIP